ncbi:MAG: 3-hydroxyisobutyrate dehydrogenase [bacterium]|nr:3-hydroxyisobutyrate dehydrogenase [bacterium]
MTTIAFFGCGNMGAPMVRNLLKAGYAVRVFDLNHALSAALASDGAFVAASAAQAVQGAHTVITMLPHDAAVTSVYLDEKTGLLAQLFKGSLIIDCSTVSPQCARTISAAAHEHQLAMIDAPVSGGVAGAEAGTLSFLCGGSVDEVERARPFLAVMGKNTLHAGAAGAGAVAKVCNNMLLAVHMIGTCEALQLGVDNGLDPAVLSDILLKSSGKNWSLEVYNPWPGVMENSAASREYSGGFQTDLMNKDLGLAMQAAQQSKSVTPLGALAKQLFALHATHGNGKLDFSSILKMLQA